MMCKYICAAAAGIKKHKSIIKKKEKKHVKKILFANSKLKVKKFQFLRT